MYNGWTIIRDVVLNSDEWMTLKLVRALFFTCTVSLIALQLHNTCNDTYFSLISAEQAVVSGSHVLVLNSPKSEFVIFFLYKSA